MRLKGTRRLSHGRESDYPYRPMCTPPCRRILSFVFTFILALATPSIAQQPEWKDPSPHATRFVTVDENVQLEVLDWGGSGPALVLLAGLGGTAHQYDDFAQALTPRYRIIGVTRRGHRGSSAAPGGYGFARLAEDILRVIDAVGLNKPVVIGHSFAGEEMHVLGARHASKISGLVYVDAAFDRGDDADNIAFNAVARTVPAAPSPKSEDLASFTSLRAYLEKYGGAGPEGYLRTRYRANADGSVAGLWAPDVAIRQAMAKEIQAAYKPYTPERILVPALAVYAVPKSADDLMRRGSSDRLAFPDLAAGGTADPAIRERVERLYLLTRERVRNHEKWFEAFAERGRVAELSGTHDLIVSNPREVLRQVEAFVSSLATPVFAQQPVPLAPDDAAAIQALVSSYARALGGCRAEEFADLFAPDTGYFASGIRGQIVGRERLIALVQSERHCTASPGTTTAARPGGTNGPTVAVEVTASGVRGIADMGAAGQYQDEYVKTATGWRFLSRTVLIPAERNAGLDAKEMAAIQRVAGPGLGDYYVPDPNGVKRLRTSGVEIKISNGAITGRAYLKSGGYYDDVYEKVAPGEWRITSRTRVTGPTSGAP